MHSAQGAAVTAQGVVDLHETSFEPGLTEFALTEESGEKAALVLALIKLDQIGASERDWDKAHDIVTRSRFWRRSALLAGRGDGAGYAAGQIGHRRNRRSRSGDRKIALAAPPCRRPACIRAGSQGADGQACQSRRGSRADPCRLLR